jgi:hypothetical protein
VTQEHVLLIYKFPEDYDEITMQYTSSEASIARQDGEAFADMYPGVVYIYVVYVFDHGGEEELWRWTNPHSEKLQSLVNSAGAVHWTLDTTSASAPSAGPFFRKLSKAFSDKRLALRPPLAEQFASPLPTTSKPYGGRNRRTRRAPRR